tara:strand:- start:27977 stop:29302 length:1326 start_codon:yes stop_codon:yes gene_type:complete
MKLFFVFLILLFTSSCSFDNRSGIWKNDTKISKKESGFFKDFKQIGTRQSNFNEIIELKKKINFDIPKKINNNKWEDVYYNQSNNQVNFTFDEKKNLIFKSKNISKYKIKKLYLYDKGNLIFTDERGNLIVFSIKTNKIIAKLNFYKKKYKKVKKNLNIVVNNSIIYTSDNLGFIYAYDYNNKKVLWAKNNKIPFRSNLKIFNNKLIASDQNNRISIFDKKNGNILKLIPTEETKIKNDFENNFSINKRFIFMLNTYGSLYSINNKNNNVKWVTNLNQSIDINPSNLFNGHELVSNEDYVIVSSVDATYIISSINGAIISKFNIVSKVKPLIIKNHLFLVSSNNLLICINIETSEIVYSLNIDKKIAEFLKIKQESSVLEDILFANNKILIQLKNSYIVEFDIKGDLINIFKLKNKINSKLIFIDNSILYLNKNNKLIVLG